MSISPRARVLLIALLVFGALTTIIWYLSTKYWTQPVAPLDLQQNSEVIAPSPQIAPTASETPTITPSPALSLSPTGSPTAVTSATPAPLTTTERGSLAVPVAGVKPEQLKDTYNDARSEGRVHNAIDIDAPRGTPVIAAGDGRIVRLFFSDKGGNTLYQLSPDEKLIYYYAHLDRYADDLKEGHYARRGETIAYVGDTGNATPGNYHLHFQVYRITDPKHFWDGENLNPYDLLKRD